MTDRPLSDQLRYSSETGHDGTGYIMDEAADEIERLQAQVTELEAAKQEGWKEAAIAWAACASLHRKYCKGKDPFYKTRQADFVRHETDARAALKEGE